MTDHQRSLEELKASLSSDHTTSGGQEQDAQELRATLDSLKMEHQLEVENLKAKHKIEAAILTKEREDLCSRLQQAKSQLAEGNQTLRGEVEAKGGKQALEDVTDKLQKAEQRLAEMEELHVEQDRSIDALRGRLALSEKTTSDYQALQKAQAESQKEIQNLEEKLRVTTNQLQALQANRYTSNDANVSDGGDGSQNSKWCDALFTLCFLQVIEDNDISDEKMKLKQNIEGTNVSCIFTLNTRWQQPHCSFACTCRVCTREHNLSGLLNKPSNCRHVKQRLGAVQLLPVNLPAESLPAVRAQSGVLRPQRNLLTVVLSFFRNNRKVAEKGERGVCSHFPSRSSQITDRR